MAFLFDPHFQAIDASGNPMSGATLTFYRAGTSSKITVYQNSEATTPHTNPVVADASGAFPAIFLATTANYKIILKTSLGVTVATVDRIPAGSSIDTETLGQAVEDAQDAATEAQAVADMLNNASWQGDWSGATTYALYDSVLSAGSSWRSKQAGNLNHLPPTLPTTSDAWWQLVARRGVDGAGTVVSIVAGNGISVDSSDPTNPVISTPSSRTRLTTNRTYYVRSDGSDSNTGLANTSGGAFLTIQKAVNTALWTIDTAGFDVTVQVGDGTYTAGVTVSTPVVGGGRLFITGNTATPANCFVDVVGNAFSAFNNAQVEIKGFKTRTTTSGTHIFASDAHIRFGYWDFGAGAGAHIEVSPAGLIEAFTNYLITGSATSHGHTPMTGGNIVIGSDGPITVTLSGAPNFSIYFFGTAGGKVTCRNSVVTFVGSATGARAYAHSCGIIDAGGDTSRTYLPGSTGITEQSGGLYIGYEGAFPVCLGAQLPDAAPNIFNSYIVADCSTMTIGASVNGGGSGFARVTSNGSVWKVQELIT